MSKRDEHTFQFKAIEIAEAAEKQAVYHEQRLKYWEKEYDSAVRIVNNTIGAKLVKQRLTRGYRVEVVVNYGDPSAYSRLQEAFRKIETHRKSAEEFRSDQQVYSTQGERFYELALDDVQYYHLDGRVQEEGIEEEDEDEEFG
jgi:hypothetical protein